MVGRFQPDAVVHIAAIPDIEHNAPHTVFTNNISATFNVVEACVMFGVKRLVNISSEQAPGFFSNNGPPGGAVTPSQFGGLEYLGAGAAAGLVPAGALIALRSFLVSKRGLNND